ncbi:MmcQ/YjbR family DNA-binding protein [Gordonibacter massiliensis (ex Traore et al. 2017)]|uniref:MmcQ/YjbR family DNA-binding protein n=1 Tax=Gordonibacter massiliensis (ex Traore et al. 2017) TaxID=1841863 RepID=UPI001C8C271A|nr:MmcQ/YjbR family DNA-binding protein [Gordonibacter massiliensis (ex Traore et al. 2017)]MBX9032944.1 MmcQ/YjbR family DNA-binding protein [Gordonibacter massiliensis (ex Traore et al. 2017)]
MTVHDWLDEYLLSKPGATKDYKVEWEWWRYQVGGKMFAATMQPGEQHREYAGLNLVSLKCDPVWSERLRADWPGDILPGFYADKRCWISVDLDGTVPEDLLRELCDHSYSLVFAKLTKKLQREIAGL